MLYVIIFFIFVLAVAFSVREGGQKADVGRDEYQKKEPPEIGEDKIGSSAKLAQSFDIVNVHNPKFIAEQRRIVGLYVAVLEKQKGIEGRSILPFNELLIKNAIKYQALYYKRQKLLSGKMLDDISTVYSRLAWFVNDQDAKFAKNITFMNTNGLSVKLEDLEKANEINFNALQKQGEYYSEFEVFSVKYLS